MARLICGLILVLLVASSSLGQQSLVGTYKLISLAEEIDGKPTETMGKAPHGYLVVTPTRVTVFYTAENRKFGTSLAEKAALLDTMVAWSATYRVEGDKLINVVDVYWLENMNGNTRVYGWQSSGNRLTLTQGPMPYPRDPTKTRFARQIWEKVE
jgi:hypothetical protein